MSEIERDSAVSGHVADEHTALVSKFAHHYAQSKAWTNEAARRKSAGDMAGHAVAEQHALGHSLSVEHTRNQMPLTLRMQVQAHANKQNMQGNIQDTTPVPAPEVPVNGGGLNGDLKWTPPKGK